MRCHYEARNLALAAAGLLVLLLATATPGLVSLAAEISFEIMTDKDAPGNDFKRFKGVSLQTCEARCREESKCAAFTYNHSRKFCFLKDRMDPQLSDYRGATTGLKTILQDAAQTPSEPEDGASAATKDATAAPQPPDEPVIRVGPATQAAASACTLFDGDFALIRNPGIVLKFDQVQGETADKARMAFYDRGDKVLSGRLRLEADRFRFIEDGAAPVSRGVTILDRTHPSGNSIDDPVFVVVGGLPFDGGVFKRAPCGTGNTNAD